jgi:hypothetical protein
VRSPHDLPAISITSRDVPSPTNPLGVKGAGEGVALRPAPASCERRRRFFREALRPIRGNGLTTCGITNPDRFCGAKEQPWLIFC